jgi:hypothetical protein
MTSLALAAAHTAAPAFNRDFYTTAATVIPVLYIALAVQGHAGASLNNAAARFWDRKPAKLTGLTTLIKVTGTAALAFTAAAILVGGAVAEMLAIVNLYFGSQTTASGPFVLWLTILLVAAAAAGPVLDFSNAPDAEASAAEEQSAPDPEPGKTDLPA